MFKLFCLPGRILAKLFSPESRRSYRSIRSKPSYGAGVILLSLISWLALAGGILYAVDKAGLLKQALDAGVEVAQGGETGVGNPPPGGAEAADGSSAPNGSGAGGSSPSASGGLAPENQSTTDVSSPPGSDQSGATVSAAPSDAVQVEQWLVILHTIPKSGRAEAERRKTQYRNKGLNVDILDTDAFPRLVKGNWIIALGPFDQKAEAVTASNKAKQYNSSLMVRQGF